VETSEDRFFAGLGDACAELRQSFAAQVGMSAPGLRVLMMLWRNGETSHSELRRVLALDGASVTRLIKAFETDGLVGRRLDPGDNRYTLARLTAAGERVVAELDRAHQTYQERLLAGVSAHEQKIVLRVLERLRGNAADVRSAPASPVHTQEMKSR
jgi:DNA-binding MarR family transcriptional regulator